MHFWGTHVQKRERGPLITLFGVVVIVAYCAVLLACVAYLLLNFVPTILPHKAAFAVGAAAFALGLLMMPDSLTKNFSRLADFMQVVGVWMFLGAIGVLLGQILEILFPGLASVSNSDALLVLIAILLAAILYKLNKREP
jgi:Na+/citrate or Na+/malate symporter